MRDYSGGMSWSFPQRDFARCGRFGRRRDSWRYPRFSPASRIVEANCDAIGNGIVYRKPISRFAFELSKMLLYRKFSTHHSASAGASLRANPWGYRRSPAPAHQEHSNRTPDVIVRHPLVARHVVILAVSPTLPMALTKAAATSSRCVAVQIEVPSPCRIIGFPLRSRSR